MKKLSVLVALMLIITVGGVYATWNYAQATGEADAKFTSVSVKLADIDYDENDAEDKGTISITSNNVSLVIDQDKPSYDAKWVPNDDGQITGTFVPAANATDYVKANGTPLCFKLSGKLHDDITISPNSVDISYDRHDNGTFYWTITAAQIANAISLDDVNLPTEQAYKDFMDELGSGEITITIQEQNSEGNEQGGTSH